MKKNDEDDLNKELLEYENLEKQLEVVLIQKHQLQLQQNEVKHAIEEIKKAEGKVFRSAGSIMVQSSKAEAESDLKERQELIDVKLGALEKQEKKLRESVSEAQQSLQEKLKGHGQDAG